MSFIYVVSDDNSARYILDEKGDLLILCIGINPYMTAKPDYLHKKIDIDIHNKNLRYIKQLIIQYSKFDIWTTWGNSIIK